MASSDTEDVLIAGVLLSGTFVSECKKKLISANEAFKQWIEEREKHGARITVSLQGKRQTNNN